jgi:hypothetical protein
MSNSLINASVVAETVEKLWESSDNLNCSVIRENKDIKTYADLFAGQS